MKFEIRPYHSTDLSSIYRICLLTGFNGGDATPHLEDPDLVGHLFAAPYAIYESSLCFIFKSKNLNLWNLAYEKSITIHIKIQTLILRKRIKR